MPGKGLLAAAGAALLSCAVALAHGGGGGGGGHGSHVIVTGGVYISGGEPLVPPDPELGDTNAIHTVAVLSGFAATLKLQTGGGIFGTSKMVDVSHWGLDDYASALVKKHLASRFQVRDIVYDRSALVKIPKGDSQQSLTLLHNYFATIANPGVDAFVVLRPDDPSPYVLSAGLELLSNGGFAEEGLGYEIEMYDAHTFARIARAFARIQTREGTSAAMPEHIVSADRALAHDLSLTDFQQTLVRKDFQWGIAETAVDTLRSLQWGLDIPPAGVGQIMPWPAGQSAFPQIHSVAIYSTVGTGLQLAYRATMFRHGNDTMPVADWNLDSEIESMATANLNKSFVVKRVPQNRAALVGNTVSGTSLIMPVAGLVPSNDVDAYLVVLRHSGLGTDLQDEVSGLGVSKRDTISDETTYVFADYALALLDARTLAPIAFKVAVASPHYANAMPFRPVKNADWTYGTTVLTAEQSTWVHQALHDTMNDSLCETFLQMGIGAAMRQPLDTPDYTPWTPQPLVVVEPEKPPTGASSP